ncbi:MAG: PTS glucose transporter subunit IIA [Oscillospiraceae bacterium]|nr:PTS glucose transporter subunit IIA [Oscillospiraceae bacterium]
MSGDTVCSPCTGTITTLADTHHAIGVTCPDGVEILIHIGINTVELNGQGFQPLVKEGDKVTAGQPIIKADMKLLKGKGKGYGTTTMLIITDDNGKTITFKPYGAVSRGDIVSG